MVQKVVLYTDGSCLGNPGSGGWAAILFHPATGTRRELSGGFARTTNNRMEILSVIRGLQAITEPCAVEVYSDSRYVCDSIARDWLGKWIKKNWVKSGKQPVKNVDLWKELLPELERHRVTMRWLRGHDGNPENERCDMLARINAAKNGLPEDPGYPANA